MIAGTLAILKEPADEPLEDYLHDSGLPALSVSRTQQGFDGTPIQQGAAAGRLDIVEKEISAGHVHDGDGIFVDVAQVEARTRVATDWVADVTDSGVILAESVKGSDPAFPLDLFWHQTQSEPVRQRIAVDEMHREWSREDVLGDVEMTTRDDEEDGVSIDWGDAASEDDTPTIGLGFRRPWSGTAIRGVVYETGYVALYSAGTASKAVRFIAEELLEFCSPLDGEESAQMTLADASGGDNFADEVADHLEDEGYDVEREEDWDGNPADGECARCERDDFRGDLTDEGLCGVCDDKIAEDREREAYEKLETVTMSDGGDGDGS